MSTKITKYNIEHIIDRFVRFKPYVDSYGNESPKTIYDDEYIISRNEADEYIISLKQINTDDSQISVRKLISLANNTIPPFIEYVEIDEDEAVVTENQYKFIRQEGYLLFHSSQLGQKVLVDYESLGVATLSANMIYTEFSSNGNVITLLSELVRQCNEAIAKVITIGDANALCDQLKTLMKDIINTINYLNKNLPVAKQISDELRKQIPLAQKTQVDLQKTIDNAKDIDGKITNSGNRDFTIEPYMWKSRVIDGVTEYYYVQEHDMKSMSLHFTPFEVTERGNATSTANCTVLTQDKFEVSSDVNIKAIITVSARYYTGQVVDQSAINTALITENFDKQFVNYNEKANVRKIPNLEQNLNIASKQLDSTMKQIANNLLLSKTFYKLIYKQALKGVAIGDSWTQGVTSGTTGMVSYPTELQRLLRQNYGYNNIDIINNGVGGWRSIDGLLHFKEKVLDLKPDFVIIMFGINDCRGINGEIISINDYRNNIINMVKQCTERGIEVCIISSGAINDTTNNANVNLISYVNVAREVSTQFNCAFVDLNSDMYELYLNRAYTPSDLIGVDNVHPPKYEYVANIIFKEAFNKSSSCKVLNIDNECSVPIVHSPYVSTDLKGVLSSNYTRNKKYYVVKKDASQGTYLNFPFIVSTPNMDLKLICLKNMNCGLLDVYDNGVKIKSINFFNKESNNIFEVNQTLISNLSVGSHFVEIKSNNISDGLSTDTTRTAIFLDYFEFVKSDMIQNNDFEMFNSALKGNLRYKSDGNMQSKLILNKNVELKEDKTLIVEVRGKFDEKTAFTWLGNKSEIIDGSIIKESVNNGYGLIFENNSLKLRWYGDKNALQTLGTGDSWTGMLDLTKEHLFRIEQKYNGEIKVFMDGVQVIMFTKPVAWSGYFGIYTYNSIPSVIEISSINFCYK